MIASNLSTSLTIAACALASPLFAQVSLTHLGTVDVSTTSNAANPEYIGSNPSAVAWNGVDLWVAGFNSSGATGDAAIVGVSNALTNPTYGTRFGVQAATPNSRGYSGLDVSGNLLTAAYDPGGVSPEGITGWDLTGAPLWSKAARGGSGVGIDPGFGGVDAGTGWTSFGSGRRSLQDNVTGADIYTSSNGMIINSGSGTFWRDMDFDSLIGDIYLRKGNQVHKCQRIGGNSVTGCVQLTNVPQQNFIAIQNLAYVRQGSDELVFWNDRGTTLGGQAFETVIQAIDANGQPLTIDYGGFTAPSGPGAYDFSYDEATRTLAICDYGARAVYVFAVALFNNFGTGCPGLGGITPQLDGRGNTSPNGVIDYTATDLAPLSIGVFAFGNVVTTQPLPFPGACPLHVDPLIGVYNPFVTAAGSPGSGSGSMSVLLPPGLLGSGLTAQCVVLENGSVNQIVTSNAVQVTLP